MADLNEEVVTVTRKRWDRTNKVRIESEYGKPPKIVFEIQTVTTDNGELVGATPKSLLEVEYDPEASYPLINPQDGSIIAESGGSHDMLNIQLYSMFRHLVKW